MLKRCSTVAEMQAALGQTSPEFQVQMQTFDEPLVVIVPERRLLPTDDEAADESMDEFPEDLVRLIPESLLDDDLLEELEQTEQM